MRLAGLGHTGSEQVARNVVDAIPGRPGVPLLRLIPQVMWVLTQS